MVEASEVVDVLKDARAVYKAAKQIGKDLDAEEKVAAADMKKLRDLNAKLQKVAADLPDAMTISERRAMVSATRALLKDRRRRQKYPQDLAKMAELDGQLFELTNAELRLRLLEHFDPRRSAPGESLGVLLEDVAEVHGQIRSQLRARGYVRFGVRVSIFAANLGLLIAKAA